MALTPLWVFQVATGAKSFGGNPILGSPWLNALGLHNLRQDIAHALAERRRMRLALPVDPKFREEFALNGFVVVPGFLPMPDFTSLLHEVRAYRSTSRETLQGDTITRRFALDSGARRAMPRIAHVIDHPVWRSLVRYVGSHDQEPVCYIQSILSRAVAGPPDPQTELHADTFQPTVKAWLTLTDVAADGAPFVYVPGSHRLTPERRQWERRMSVQACRSSDRLSRRGSFRIEPKDLPTLGYSAPRTFAVPPNTLIVADTSGFHARGPSAAPGIRVEVWAYGRRNPFFSPPLDPWRIEPLSALRAPLFWRAGDALDRLGLRKQVWRRVTNSSAFDCG